jgi:hypothetical protein
VFLPTKSYYIFNRLADAKDIARYEPLSTEAHVRHAGVTGDTVEYQPSDVLLMARRVALDAARREWR